MKWVPAWGDPTESEASTPVTESKQVDLGLVDHPEPFPRGERFAQICLQGTAQTDGGVHLRLEEGKLTAAGPAGGRGHYNAIWPHASLDYRPPAPELFAPTLAAWPATPSRPAPLASSRWRRRGDQTNI